MCRHEQTVWTGTHTELGQTGLHYLQLDGRCTACGAAIVWRGPPGGISPDGPTTSPDGRTLRIPFQLKGDRLPDLPPHGFAVAAILPGGAGEGGAR